MNAVFGEEEYILGNVRITRAKREPCIVCGDPTGDCSSGISGPIRVLGESFASSKAEPGVLVQEDITEEVWLTPYTRTTVLVARAGSYISLEKAIELGIKNP